MDALAMIGAVIGKVRRNHALEHATIAVLLARHGLGLQLAGHAAPGGFYISGNVTAAQVGSAAEEALVRLQGGERHLALSPLCGTNIVLGGGLAGLASLAVLGSGDRRAALAGRAGRGDRRRARRAAVRPLRATLRDDLRRSAGPAHHGHGRAPLRPLAAHQSGDAQRVSCNHTRPRSSTG